MNVRLIIDKAGRVVIPKPVRDELHLDAGDALEMESAGEQITLRPVRGTGPLTKETTPYTVTGNFNGRFLSEIVVIGVNKTEVVSVKEVPFTTEDELMKEFSTA